MRESGLEDVAVEWREEQDGAADARRLTLGDGGAGRFVAREVCLACEGEWP